MRFTFLLWIGLFFFYSNTTAKELKKNFSHTFDVSKGTVLIIDNGDGNVRIKTWEKDQIKVDVTYHAQIRTSSQKDLEDFNVRFNQSGDKVYVTGEEHKRTVFGYFSINYIEYQYDILLPSYLETDILSDDGNVMIENLSADIRIKTDDGNIELYDVESNKSNLTSKDGNIRLESITGNLNIHCDDGNIDAKNMNLGDAEITSSDGRVKINKSRGNFYISSDDGDVTLTDVSGEILDIRTKDGDADVRFSGKGKVDVVINTKDGRVNLELGEEISAVFSAETDEGRIRFDVTGADIDRDSRRSVRGKLGNSEGQLRIRTNDGSISVSSNY